VRVALTMREVQAPSYRELRDAISHDWIEWLSRQGATPVLIPNSIPDPAEFVHVMAVDLIILTGGNDSVPGDDQAADYSALRNEQEFKVLDFAVAKGKPVLGVCRGMHIINLYFGGTVRFGRDDARATHVAQVHGVEFFGAVGRALRASEAMTNSFHSQLVLDQDIGDGLLPFARCSDDQAIEGLVHETAPVLGIQWHPEREQSAETLDVSLMNRLARERRFWDAA